MTVTNLTEQDYWFGPLHLPAGNGQTLVVDDTSETSLYLTSDAVADALNALYLQDPALITVTGAAEPFPRPTGVPQVVHGDGSPDGVVFAPQGSLFLRRDNTGATTGLYTKTTGITFANGWQAIGVTDAVAPTGVIQAYGGATAPDGWLICDGAAHSRSVYSDLFGVVGTDYGSGDGSTTFNVPDLRGRVAVGYAASGGHVDVSTLGNNDGQASANRRPKHRTSSSLSVGVGTLALQTPGGSIVVDSGGGSASSQGGSWGGKSVTVTGSPSLSGSIGTNNANDALDTPSYLVVNHIIKT